MGDVPAEVKKPNKQPFSYMALSRFVEGYNFERMGGVSDEIIRQAEQFKQWPVKQVEVTEQQLYSAKKSPRKEWKDKKKEELKKQQSSSSVRIGDQTKESGTVQILLGKNIDLNTLKMRNELKERAKNNKFLEESSAMLEKADSEITFILNRITEEYFDDFVDELQEYASHECHSVVLSHRIIEKVGEEHGYIRLYSKLVDKLRKIKVGEERLSFKRVFVDRLQCLFYEWVQNGEWEGRE